MIISASYRTDIPAFHSAWFQERWAAGSCEVPNPYNQKLYTVSLNPKDVDGIVFWTRSAKPLSTGFDRVAADGVPFVISYTTTGYGSILEPGVPDWQNAAETMHDLCNRFGPNTVVWRYDPILITESTPERWHIDHFATMANHIQGATNEVIVSFAQFYAKTKRGLAQMGVQGKDPSPQHKMEILQKLSVIASTNGMRLSLCAQPEFLIPEVHAAACIDIDRLSRIAGHPVKAKMKPHRPNCGCAQSRDIGTFATCKFGCAYCYAK